MDRFALIVKRRLRNQLRYCFRRHFPYADNNLSTEQWQPRRWTHPSLSLYSFYIYIVLKEEEWMSCAQRLLPLLGTTFDYPHGPG